MRDEKPSKADWIQSVLAEHEKPLVRYAQHLTGSLDMARDAVQETFLRLCAQDPRKLEGRIAPWLFAVCRTRALDALRRERRLNSRNAEGESEQDSALERDADSIELYEQNQVIARILDILSKLSANQQEVIRLRFEEGFSYQEISQVTGLSVTNVGFLLHAGLRTIRQQMEPREDAPMMRRIK